MYIISYLPNNCVLFVLRNDAVNHNTYLIYFDTAFLCISDWLEIVVYVSNCINSSILSLISPYLLLTQACSFNQRIYVIFLISVETFHTYIIKHIIAISLYKLEKRLRWIRNIFDPTSLFSFTLISLIISKLDNSVQLLNNLAIYKIAWQNHILTRQQSRNQPITASVLLPGSLRGEICILCWLVRNLNVNKDCWFLGEMCFFSSDWYET